MIPGVVGVVDLQRRPGDNVRSLTDSDPIVIADIGARYEILPMKQLRMRETN
jgi:hypothetical protein